MIFNGSSFVCDYSPGTKSPRDFTPSWNLSNSFFETIVNFIKTTKTVSFSRGVCDLYKLEQVEKQPSNLDVLRPNLSGKVKFVSDIPGVIHYPDGIVGPFFFKELVESPPRVLVVLNGSSELIF